jgi:DNA (cytosine-5)-methyltransferase 3A
MDNYPNTIQLGDINHISSNNLPKIDLLFGGSPCQSFSSFGDKSGFNGKSGLFYEYVRLLNEVKPTYFLLENVNMKKEWRDIISQELGVEPIAINSNLVSAQNRDRLYWTNIKFDMPKDKGILLKDILTEKEFREIPKCFYKNWGNQQRINKGINWVGNQKANCLTTKNCHTNQYLLNEDKSLCRLLTADEFEKLQTVTLGYTKSVSDTERFRMLGNGWTVDVIAHIFKHLKHNTMEELSFDDLINNVYHWANEKELINPAFIKQQFLKVAEELGETASAISKNKPDELIDGLGDTFVTLIILTMQCGLTPQEALNSAWNEIKHRKGKTTNGVFIKE